MKNIIYADNASTTKLDEEAFDAMKPFLMNEYANPSQPYSFSRFVKKALKEARFRIAECINALPEEIFFTSGGTESNNWAIKGLMEYKDLRTTITTNMEHYSVIKSCESIEKLGFPVVYIPVEKSGVITLESLSRVISDNTKLVSVMMVNNEIGTIQPIRELANIAHYNGALFHSDAVQAIGHIPVDVSKLNVDMLSGSAHKFNGPKGVGFLYIKKNTKINAYLNGGKQEFDFRAGTENVASIVGMSVALKKNNDEMNQNRSHTKFISKTFIENLKINYILNGDKGKRIEGINSISIPGMKGESLLHLLDLKGVYVSTGSACDSSNTQISHVLNAINIPEDVAKGTIRISFGKDNTESEAIMLAQIINKIVLTLDK